MVFCNEKKTYRFSTLQNLEGKRAMSITTALNVGNVLDLVLWRNEAPSDGLVP